MNPPLNIDIEKMTPTLRFSFGGDWDALKWDDHVAYREGLERLKRADGGDSDAIDIVAWHEKATCFVEVKDFRVWSSNIQKPKPSVLAEKIAFKVRDTIAGIVGARYSRNEPAERWEHLVLAWARRCEVFVVFWFEEDHLGSDESRKAAFANLTDQIEAKLSWLRPRVLVRGLKVSNRLGEHPPLADITAHNLLVIGRKATPPGAAPSRRSARKR